MPGVTSIFRALLASLLVVTGTALVGRATSAGQATPEIRHILAPTGVLRVALYTGAPTSVLSATDLRGVGYDLGKELARRLGVPYQPIIFPKNADVLDSMKGGSADVAFTNASAERARGLDFTQPYLLIELGYLVAGGSAVAAPGDVDRPGVRIGVTAKSTSDSTLTHDLMNAQVIRAETVTAGIRMLKDGKIDVYATNKATLFEMADQLPGSHVLEGSWGLERHALALPKGRGKGLPFARAFIADAAAKGLVSAVAARAGIRGATVVGRSP
jgi:polar amino acid transport system substrate-binding protein